METLERGSLGCTGRFFDRVKTRKSSSASQDPLCLSPEDNLWPPARERTWFRRLSETPALALRENIVLRPAFSVPFRESRRDGLAEGVCGLPGADVSGPVLRRELDFSHLPD